MRGGGRLGLGFVLGLRVRATKVRIRAFGVWALVG